MTPDKVATWVTIVAGCVGILAALVAIVRWAVKLRRRDVPAPSDTTTKVLIIVVVISGVATSVLDVSLQPLLRLHLAAPLTVLADSSGAPWLIVGGALLAIAFLVGGWLFLWSERKRAKLMRLEARHPELDR